MMGEMNISRRQAMTGALACIAGLGSSAAGLSAKEDGCIRWAASNGSSGLGAGFDTIWDGTRLIKRQADYEKLGLALARISRFFGARASFSFYDDSANPNAGAADAIAFPGVNGAVLMGRMMFHNATTRYRSGDFTLLLLTAHEFGHITQFGTTAERRFLARGAGGTRLMELHADFLAGYYLAELRRINRATLNGQAADQALRDLGSIGLAPDHGRPAERAAVANAGYELGWAGALTYTGAFEHGADLILSRY